MKRIIRRVRSRAGRRRREAGLAAVLLLVLAVGPGVTAAALDFVRQALSTERVIDSPVGLPIPPAVLELESGSDPRPPSAEIGMLGGALPQEGPPPTTIGAQQREALRIVLGSVAGAALVVLLVTLTNISLLLASRGSARRPELAVRAALGATRRRLVLGSLAVHAPLLATAATLGAAIAALLRALISGSWPSGADALSGASANPAAIAIVLALPLLLAGLVSILPALRLDDRDLRATAGAAARTTAPPGERRLRRRLTIFGIAASVTLLIAAGLLLRGFGRGAGTALVPYDPRDTLTFVVRPAVPAPRADDAAALQASILAAASTAPEVRHAAVSSEGLWLGLGSAGRVHSHTGSVTRPGITGYARHAAVSPGAFTAFGAPLEGRDFSRADAPGAEAVAIVNRTFANRYFFGSPVGRTVQLGRSSLDPTLFRVVGVVEDFRPLGVGNAEQPEPLIAFSARQLPPPTFELALRLAPTADPDAARERIERALATAAPDAIVTYTGTREEGLAGFRAPLAWLGALFAGLAFVAALLAAVGLHGLIAFDVRTRTREIGIRLALGASPSRVVRELLAAGLRTTGAGIVLGLAGALCVGRLLQFTFTGVRLIDPLVHLPVLLLTLAIAMVATLRPARTAARVDPLIALSHD